MAAGAFSINCGQPIPEPHLDLPLFDTYLKGKVMVLEEGSRIQCLANNYCEDGSCERDCQIYEKNSAEPEGFKHTDFNYCKFEQELSDDGDSLIIYAGGEEVFRIHSADKLYANETEIIDRESTHKKLRVLGISSSIDCADYVKNVGLNTVEP